MYGMAYLKVSNWTPKHVSEWVSGLPDEVCEYSRVFEEAGIHGDDLIQLTAGTLPIASIGHQRILLQCIEQLILLQFELNQNTLQSVIAKLRAKARTLLSDIRTRSGPAIKSFKNLSGGPRWPSDLLIATCHLIDAIKLTAEWMDCPQLRRNESLQIIRKKIVENGLTLSYKIIQKDSDLLLLREEIMILCDCIITDCNVILHEFLDSSVNLTYTLELATVTRKPNEEWGLKIISSYNGRHRIESIAEGSPAYYCGKICVGDEIIQVNYQTVIGWKLQKMLNVLTSDPRQVVFMLKKSPSHFPVSRKVPLKKRIASETPAPIINLGVIEAKHVAADLENEVFESPDTNAPRSSAETSDINFQGSSNASTFESHFASYSEGWRQGIRHSIDLGELSKIRLPSHITSDRYLGSEEEDGLDELPFESVTKRSSRKWRNKKAQSVAFGLLPDESFSAEFTDLLQESITVQDGSPASSSSSPFHICRKLSRSEAVFDEDEEVGGDDSSSISSPQDEYTLNVAAVSNLSSVSSDTDSSTTRHGELQDSFESVVEIPPHLNALAEISLITSDQYVKNFRDAKNECDQSQMSASKTPTPEKESIFLKKPLLYGSQALKGSVRGNTVKQDVICCDFTDLDMLTFVAQSLPDLSDDTTIFGSTRGVTLSPLSAGPVSVRNRKHSSSAPNTPPLKRASTAIATVGVKDRIFRRRKVHSGKNKTLNKNENVNMKDSVSLNPASPNQNSLSVDKKLPRSNTSPTFSYYLQMTESPAFDSDLAHYSGWLIFFPPLSTTNFYNDIEGKKFWVVLNRSNLSFFDAPDGKDALKEYNVKLFTFHEIKSASSFIFEGKNNSSDIRLLFKAFSKTHLLEWLRHLNYAASPNEFVVGDTGFSNLNRSLPSLYASYSATDIEPKSTNDLIDNFQMFLDGTLSIDGRDLLKQRRETLVYALGELENHPELELSAKYASLDRTIKMKQSYVRNIDDFLKRFSRSKHPKEFLKNFIDTNPNIFDS